MRRLSIKPNRTKPNHRVSAINRAYPPPPLPPRPSPSPPPSIPPFVRGSAYYPEARDYEDCLAAFYDWQDLTDQVNQFSVVCPSIHAFAHVLPFQPLISFPPSRPPQFTSSPDPTRKPRRFAERRELREELVFRLYLETPEFVSGDLYARLDGVRAADLAAMDREVNGGRGRRRRKVVVDGMGRVVPDVDPESMVLPSRMMGEGEGEDGDGWGSDGEEWEEGWDEEDEEDEDEDEAAAGLAGWDEEAADEQDSVFFERSLHPLPPGAHRWWPPPPPPPPGQAFGGGAPYLMGADGAGGVGAEEPPHGPEEEQLLFTKIVKDVFATAPPQGEAPPRLEDPFQVGSRAWVCMVLVDRSIGFA